MNPYQGLVNSALGRKRNILLLLGHGVCRDAEIHTGWDMILKTAGLLYIKDHKETPPNFNLTDWFFNSPYSKMRYMDVLEKIAPTREEQINLFKNYLDHKETGKIYWNIVSMVRHEMLAAIIDINFNHYLEKALAVYWDNVQVFSCDDDLRNAPPLKSFAGIRIYRPYGDIERGEVRLMPRDFEALSLLMQQELTKIMTDHTVVLLGYTFYRDLSMLNVIRSRGFSNYPIFYVNRKPPEGDMETVLKAKDYIFIRTQSATKFIDEVIDLFLAAKAPGALTKKPESDKYRSKSPFKF